MKEIAKGSWGVLWKWLAERINTVYGDSYQHSLALFFWLHWQEQLTAALSRMLLPLPMRTLDIPYSYESPSSHRFPV
jgi:hypothetical protein